MLLLGNTWRWTFFCYNYLSVTVAACRKKNYWIVNTYVNLNWNNTLHVYLLIYYWYENSCVSSWSMNDVLIGGVFHVSELFVFLGLCDGVMRVVVVVVVAVLVRMEEKQREHEILVRCTESTHHQVICFCKLELFLMKNCCCCTEVRGYLSSCEKTNHLHINMFMTILFTILYVLLCLVKAV